MHNRCVAFMNQILWLDHQMQSSHNLSHLTRSEIRAESMATKIDALTVQMQLLNEQVGVLCRAHRLSLIGRQTRARDRMCFVELFPGQKKEVSASQNNTCKVCEEQLTAVSPGVLTHHNFVEHCSDGDFNVLCRLCFCDNTSLDWGKAASPKIVEL